MRILKLILCSGGATAVFSGVVAALFVVARRGYGVGDIPAFLIWTVPYSAAVGLVLTAFVGAAHPGHRGLRNAGGIALGALCGVVYTFWLRAFLGAWMWTFSFPVVYCWVLGGAGGCILALEMDLKRLA